MTSGSEYPQNITCNMQVKFYFKNQLTETFTSDTEHYASVRWPDDGWKDRNIAIKIRLTKYILLFNGN